MSTPFDPVHLTHVGFNSSTGEYTGLPREWRELLADSGVSRAEQERYPQAVMEIVKFYQETQGATDNVWDKINSNGSPNGEPNVPGRSGFQNLRPPPPPPAKYKPPVPTTPSSFRPAPSAPRPLPPLPKPRRSVPPSTIPAPPTPGQKTAREWVDLAAVPPSPVVASLHEHADEPTMSDAAPPKTEVAQVHPVRERVPETMSLPSLAVARLAKYEGEAARPSSWSVHWGPDEGSCDGDTVEQLRAMCTDADPKRLYINPVKIGQG